MLTQPPLPTAPCRDRPNIELADPHANLWTLALRRLSALLTVWAMRRRTRRVLSQLDDRQLADVGLKRSQALLESAKPRWRP